MKKHFTKWCIALISIMLSLTICSCSVDNTKSFGKGNSIDSGVDIFSGDGTTSTEGGNTNSTGGGTNSIGGGTNSTGGGTNSTGGGTNSTGGGTNSTGGGTNSTGGGTNSTGGGTNSSTPAETSGVALVSYQGVSEAANIVFTDSNPSSAKAYYKKSSDSAYVEADNKIVYMSSVGNGQGRADFLGLAAGTYDLKVVTSGNSLAEVKSLNIAAYDRSGYAHFNYTSGVGAYKDDGTLKSGINVVYVTENTKNSVGLAAKLKAGNTCVRIVGKISCPQYLSANNLDSSITDITGITRSKLSNDSYWNMVDIDSKSNITVEGVGDNAVAFQWGMTFKKCTSIEVRNLTFTDYPEDACAFEGTQSSSTKFVGHYWVHNNVFNKGKNGWDLTSEHDKGEGDGATDIKKCSYATYSYNRYNGCHKTGLVGGDDNHYQSDITFHHNYYNGNASRTPLARRANIHMYNNYFYKATDYCVSLRANSYLFSEANTVESCDVYRDSKTGGVCKSVGDDFISTSTGSISKVARAATVSNSCSYGSTFDTNASQFYYANGASKVTYLSTAQQARIDCVSAAGVYKANIGTGATSSGGSNPGTTSPTTSGGNTQTSTGGGTTTSTGGGTATPVGGLYSNLTTSSSYGIFTVNGGVDKTGSKMADDDSQTFTAWVQLGKDNAAGYSTKSISFTATSGGTLTVYANRGSSGVAGTSVLMNVVNSSNNSIGTISFNNDGNKVYKKTFTIPSAGSYAICCYNNTSSWNVFAIGFSAN